MKMEKGEKYDVDALVLIGWTSGNGSGHSGYSAGYYFDDDGTYLGPDKDGIEPVFEE
jgi:hypothetical protein